INPTESAQELDASFAGATIQGTGTLWRMVSPSPTAGNEPGKPMAVNIAESAVQAAPEKMEIPPLSISIYELPVK
ncbi:MAG: hypothetical protein ACLGSH_06220, partial [Acidobacteriota bacterium]